MYVFEKKNQFYLNSTFILQILLLLKHNFFQQLNICIWQKK